MRHFIDTAAEVKEIENGFLKTALTEPTTWTGGNFTVRKYLQQIVFGVVLLGIVALAAYPYPQARNGSALVVSSATKDDKLYFTDMKELRTRFNKDKGRVRLLMLLSPT